MSGKIYLVATPIGNLGDMTYRAVEVLKQVEIIAAEDTRNTIKLLNHFHIKANMTSYHEHNKIEKAYELVNLAKDGRDIAVVTDAGMPGISDPGEELVRIAYEEGVKVSIVPGACACVSALAVSGLPSGCFVFEAFLPMDRKARKEVLERLSVETRTIVLYEAPHKLIRTLAELADYLGETRRVSIVRELTKIYEEVWQTTLIDALKAYRDGKIKIRGEYVLVISGMDSEELKNRERARYMEMNLAEHIAIYERKGIGRKEAMKLVARDRGITKREVYKALLEL